MPDLRIETHTRGKTKVFIRMERKLPNGAWSVTHSYLVAGEIFSMEEDKDGDGFFETMIAFDPPNNDLEVFSRKKDGLTVVASADAKASYQEMFKAVDEFWDKAPGATDEKAAEELISQTKEKIDSAGRKMQSPQKPSADDGEERQKPK